VKDWNTDEFGSRIPAELEFAGWLVVLALLLVSILVAAFG